MDRFTVIYSILPVLAAFVTLLCAVALLTAWILLPDWRTLQAYISCNEIITGAVGFLVLPSSITTSFELLALDILNWSDLEITRLYWSKNIFLLSCCWSLCGSVVAYMKLVRVQAGRTSHEKKIATAFTLTLFGVMKFIDFAIQPIPPELFGLITLELFIFLIFAINAIIFIVICVRVMSCCRQHISNRGCDHVISLIGVGLISQGTTVILLVLIYLREDTVDYNVNIFHWMPTVLNYFRLIPPTVVVLFNKRSREHWRRYIQRRRNLAQDIPLHNQR